MLTCCKKSSHISNVNNTSAQSEGKERQRQNSNNLHTQHQERHRLNWIVIRSEDRDDWRSVVAKAVKW